MQIILFGIPGSGKNFVGEILKDDFGFFFYDGDDLLTEEMKESIKNGLMPDNLFVELINSQNNKINELKAKYPKLAFAQQLIEKPAQNRFAKLFPDAIFINIIAPIDLIVQRLRKRKNFVNEELAKKSIDSFQQPEINHYTLYNDDAKEKVKIQLNKILNTN